MKSFKHIDPSSTFVYKQHTVVYGFECVMFCFTCRVRKGYLVGRRADLPEPFTWMIGQHIDTVRPWVDKLMPLRLVST